MLCSREVLFPADEPQNVLSVRRPSENVNEEKKHEHDDHPNVSDIVRIMQIEDDPLPYGKRRYAHQRAHGSPMDFQNVYRHEEYQKRSQKQKPPFFTCETKPKESERGSDSFTAFEFQRHGKNMPDDDARAAKIARYVGNDDIRSGKYVAAKDEIADDSGDSSFERVAEKGHKADSPAKFAEHIHRAGISAADRTHVFMLGF